jgi:hypothetical protein
MKTEVLLQELIDLTIENKKAVESFTNLPLEKLQYKPQPDAWSILECIEHLNRYGDFYLPEIRQRMSSSKHPQSDHFKPGILGNYFAKAMLPKEKLNKMKTFKSMNPKNCSLGLEVLHKFIGQQEEMTNLLEKAKSHNLNKIKTSISISNWIKLKLGDTFRVVIYHNLRHIQQAQRVLNSQS